MIGVEYIAIIMSLLALTYAAYLSLKILKLEPGSEKMQQIASAIKEGAMAYMARQYKTIAIFAVIIAVALFFLFSLPVALGFILGAILSAVSGYIGMSLSVRSTVRTAQSAHNGLKEALSTAFRGGSVTGMAVVGLALLAVSVFYAFYKDPAYLVGLGFGASLISLFARV